MTYFPARLPSSGRGLLRVGTEIVHIDHEVDQCVLKLINVVQDTFPLQYPVYNTEIMMLFRLSRYARGMSPLATAILLCLGAFLALLPTELEVSAALTPAHSSHLDQGANEAYLAVPQKEEAEERNADGPTVNADLLSALLLVVCFGAIVGWPLANGRGQRAFRFVGLDRRPSFASALGDRSFLGVFRL
jgi:hypothetical protein